MKLRNKKTGEIKELPDGFFCGENLKKICEEWEDYEEPKKYWYIGNSGEVYGFSDHFVGSELEEAHREIGNLFETKEEAELAVEKLKAWKRLREKGIKFSHHVIDHRLKCAKVIVKADDMALPLDESKQFYDDFTLIFWSDK